MDYCKPYPINPSFSSGAIRCFSLAPLLRQRGQLVRKQQSRGWNRNECKQIQRVLRKDAEVFSYDISVDDSVKASTSYDSSEETGFSDLESDSEEDLSEFDGDKEVKELIDDKNKEVLTFEDIAGTFSFELDKFQSHAIKHLLAGNSVVVCAPTGAGKTAIADAAALACISRKKKVIYTTPLKALSNQKLFEFRERFGISRTGLVTGDTTIQNNAYVTVMTTEILRNMLYEVNSDSVELTRRLNDIGLIVLDEVHYLGVPDRGSVWEELIIGCPKHIQMLCMSATVANPQDLGDWISEIHGPCTTIKTSKRPVPLSWYFAFSSPHDNHTEIHPLLNKNKTKVNPVCTFEESISGFGSKESMKKIKPASRVPSLSGLILKLRQKKYLPAIVFVFSRADCDRNAIRMDNEGVNLTTEEEQAAIKAAIEAVKADQPETIREGCVGALIKGIATHHAGCLPAWKVLVESLFQEGYLKVVFATGTLAAGINMPARTTVLSTISRKINDTISLIGHNELLQMAGRAGRRGFDDEGYCIILQSRFEGAKAAFTILQSGSEPLTSQFTTGYSFVLNLLSRFSLEEAKSFLEKSFRSYLTGVGLTRREEEIMNLKQETKELRKDYFELKKTTDKENSLGQENVEVIQGKAQTKLKQLLKKARREMMNKVLEKIENLEPPFPVLLDSTKNALGTKTFPGMCIDIEVRPNSTKLLICLGNDNVFYKAPIRNVVGVLTDYGADPSRWKQACEFLQSRPSKWKALASNMLSLKGSKLTSKLAFTVPSDRAFEVITWSAATELQIKAQKTNLRKYKKEMKAVVMSGKETDETSKSIVQKLSLAEKKLRTASKLKSELENEREEGWHGFKSTLEVLILAGAVTRDTLEIQPLGHVARELYGDNELWLATVFTHQSVQLLQPSTVAALASCFVTPEVLTRPTIHINIPPQEEAVKILAELEVPRSLLYEYEVMVGDVSGRASRGLEMDSRASGLIEAWTSGCTWDQMMKDTNLDDGDLSRLLLRTRDILRQVSNSNYLLDPLRNAALRAQKAMTRKPIQGLFD